MQSEGRGGWSPAGSLGGTDIQKTSPLLEHPARGCSSAPGLQHMQLHCLGSQFSQGSSVQGVISAAQHNPRPSNPSKVPLMKRLCLCTVASGRRVSPGAQRGRTSVPPFQCLNCTLTCQQPEIIYNASLF